MPSKGQYVGNFLPLVIFYRKIAAIVIFFWKFAALVVLCRKFASPCLIMWEICCPLVVFYSKYAATCKDAVSGHVESLSGGFDHTF